MKFAPAAKRDALVETLASVSRHLHRVEAFVDLTIMPEEELNEVLLDPKAYAEGQGTHSSLKYA